MDANEETQAVHSRLPGQLYEALRRASYERHVSQNAIIIEALAVKLRPYLLEQAGSGRDG